MPRLRTNIIANFLGKGWLALMSLAFIPAYISFMGIESYGLVGFYVSLGAVLSFMELGMGTTLNREMARFSSRREADAGAIHGLLRTLEIVVWISASAIVAVGGMASSWLGEHWVNAQVMGQAQLTTAIWIMIAAIAARLPFSVYSGGLLGLQRQGLYNVILVCGATAKGAGSVLVLWAVSPTVTAFFTWQLAVELLQSVIAGIALRRALPTKSEPARFGWAHVHSVWRFSAGMMGLSILSPFVAQIDRLMVSKLLPLEAMGYYSVACAVAGGIYYIAYPVNTAVFPRFSASLERGAADDLLAIFHVSCGLMSALVWPITLTLVVYAPEILILWGRDEALAQASAVPLGILAFGAALNAMILMPLALQHARGMVKPSLVTNSAMAVLLPVALYLLIPKYGLAGAALSWVILNVSYLLAYSPITVRLIGPRETRWWVLRDVLPALIVSAGAVILANIFVPTDNEWKTAVFLIFLIISTLLLAFWGTPALRKNLMGFFNSAFKRA
ncbi:MAG: oligosaccharide flippase family protein [Gammaproteobacteria bacterium]|nr:oligosaccharide flippase family protein [Gammaproteobacteria bacterium]